MVNIDRIAENLGSVRLMGVLNITPDSFSDGGANLEIQAALATAEKMVEAGVHVLDIGGESTRPGAEPVPLEIELSRVLPVIECLRAKYPDIPISIDTYKSAVARKAIECGASWVNDISGGTFSEDMFEIVARSGATIVISHIKGTPQNMQINPYYDDVVDEITEWLAVRAECAINERIPREKIIIDPGIGFGKRFFDNITILQNIPAFKALGYKLMIGTSRKRFIGYYTGEQDASKRDPGSYITFVYAALQGADFLRVHDVPGTMQALKMATALLIQQRE